MRVLVFDPELCTGCHVCEETCSHTWFKEANVTESRIRISEQETSPGRFSANVCNQCGECMDVCPTMALARNKRGVVRLDEQLCVGCLACVGFCPILAMRVHADYASPFKCVACGKCAKECPEGALAVEELPDAALTETEKRVKVVA
jgi:Fe-S-cluster-containing dehydrogenase component